MIRKTLVGIGVIFVALFSLPFLLIVKIRKDKNLALRFIKRLSIILNKMAGNKITVTNLDFLLKTDNYVLVANHLSYFDVISIMSVIDKPIVFIAKDTLKYVPIANWWFNTLDTIYVKRGDNQSGIDTVKKAITIMRNGENMAVFPTGTRTHEHIPFKSGIIKLAQKQKKQIIPLTIKKTDLCWEHRYRFVSINSELIFHQPLSSDQINSYTTEELTELLEKTIYDAIQ